MANQIAIDLYWKTDKHNNKYLLADPDLPLNIDLRDWMMLIWPHPETSDEYPAMVFKKKERDSFQREDKDKSKDDGVRGEKPWTNR